MRRSVGLTGREKERKGFQRLGSLACVPLSVALTKTEKAQQRAQQMIQNRGNA